MTPVIQWAMLLCHVWKFCVELEFSSLQTMASRMFDTPKGGVHWAKYDKIKLEKFGRIFLCQSPDLSYSWLNKRRWISCYDVHSCSRIRVRLALFICKQLRIEFSGAIRTNSMTEFSFGMGFDVGFDLLPVAFIKRSANSGFVSQGIEKHNHWLQ